MIELHRLNGSAFFLNHRQIELIESNPDTLITLHNDRKYIVKEKPIEISKKIIQFESQIYRDLIHHSNEAAKEG